MTVEKLRIRCEIQIKSSPEFLDNNFQICGQQAASQLDRAGEKVATRKMAFIIKN